MYSSARSAAVGSANRLKSPVSRSPSECDLEAGEGTPLLVKVAKVDNGGQQQNYANQTIRLQTTAILAILALVLCLLLGIVIAVYLMVLQIPRPWPVSHPFYMVEKNGWMSGQQSPVTGLPSAKLGMQALVKSAIRNVIVVQTGSEPCYGQADCVEYVRQVHNEAVTQNGTHIPFNFLIGGDGKTYEGRGWEGQHGFTDLPGKNDTIVVGLIGTYEGRRPETIVLDEVKALLTESIRRFSLSPNYDLYGVTNRFVSQEGRWTELYKELRHWKHWKGFVIG
ncbi:peptidoglycan-recognition protein 3-like isoform X2 [Uranotaenia lowii]|uniref:peptidoglycan-recognition protein 3-like isoform X2 n=1 Tax=Uranotaenia lowii TaxID=190385 RepID=UPI0024788665|nr:peptidoglycan-recognition protein 3-like isoform X2 [Uranotaenia lowii]